MIKSLNPVEHWIYSKIWDNPGITHNRLHGKQSAPFSHDSIDDALARLVKDGIIRCFNKRWFIMKKIEREIKTG